MQTIGNYNFDVATKIESPLVATSEGTEEGLMVTSDANTLSPLNWQLMAPTFILALRRLRVV
jgi:hypothetical protein